MENVNYICLLDARQYYAYNDAHKSSILLNMSVRQAIFFINDSIRRMKNIKSSMNFLNAVNVITAIILGCLAIRCIISYR